MEKMIDKTGPKFHFHQICHHPCFCPVINFPSSCKSTFRLVSNQLSIDSNSNLCFFCFGSTFHMFLCPRIVFFFLWFFSLTIFNFSHSWICCEINFLAQFALEKSFRSPFSRPFVRALCIFSGLVPICGLPQEIYLPFPHFPLWLIFPCIYTYITCVKYQVSVVKYQTSYTDDI